jgi:excisionase family DNA binding protein
MSRITKPGTTGPISPLLRIDQVAELLGCSVKHIENLQKEGKLPARTHVSERMIGWRESDIEAWLYSNREEGTDV